MCLLAWQQWRQSDIVGCLDLCDDSDQSCLGLISVHKPTMRLAPCFHKHDCFVCRLITTWIIVCGSLGFACSVFALHLKHILLCAAGLRNILYFEGEGFYLAFGSV